jgi:hypothetical protein
MTAQDTHVDIYLGMLGADHNGAVFQKPPALVNAGLWQGSGVRGVRSQESGVRS